MKDEIKAMMTAYVSALVGVEVIAQIGEKLVKVSREDWLDNMKEIIQQLEGQNIEQNKKVI